MTSATGPYLQAALLCEKVLHETDKVLSIIRVVDGITVPDPRGAGPQGVSLILLVMLKPGDASGAHVVKVVPDLSLGMRDREIVVPTTMGEQEVGVNVTIQLSLTIRAEEGLEQKGLHWFNVLVDEHPITRVPLRVSFRPPPEPQELALDA